MAEEEVSLDARESSRDLIYQRAAIRRQITLFENHINSLNLNELTELSIINLEKRTQIFENIITDFTNVQNKLDILLEDNTQKQLQERETTTDHFYSTLASANYIIKQFKESLQSHSSSSRQSPTQTQTSSGASNVQTEEQITRTETNSSVTQTSNLIANNNNSNQLASSLIKLPPMQLPLFSGTYETWLEFRDIFKSVVHNNNELSNVQKLFYLRSALTGEAAGLIRSIASSNDNYLVAWDILENRYENTNLLINNHLKSIFNAHTVFKESATEIRNVIDIVQTNIRALNNLGLPTQSWDIIIIYLICSKLDNNTRHQWEIKRNEKQTQATLSDLLSFLRTRCSVLETLTANKQTFDQSNKQKSYVQNTQHNFNKQKTFNQNQFSKQVNQFNRNSYATTSERKNYNCTICNKIDHQIYKCPTFLNLTVQERQAKCNQLSLCKNCLRSGHSEINCLSQHCRKCDQRHNTLLHEIIAHPVNIVETVQNAHTHETHSQVLLSTVLVHVFDKNGKKRICRALLDSASQGNFITADLARDLNLDQTPTNLQICAINSTTVSSNQLFQTTVKFSSRNSDFNSNLSCIILSKITGNLPTETFNISSINIPSNIQLADNNFNISSKIDMLIGAELFYHLLLPERIQYGKNKLILQNTLLGWIFSGKFCNQSKSINRAVTCTTTLEQLVSNFWELESFKKKSTFSTIEEEACENHFVNNFSRTFNGRFIVRIPFKQNISQLGSNEHIAKQRFFSLERKLHNNQILKQAYDAFIQEYLSLGHMRQISKPQTSYFLPHHCVFKDPNNPKLRVVFDGSCKSDSNISLNDTQLVGPTVQGDLYSVLINFRMHKYALSVDMKQMYRQILVHEEDRKYQQIFYRFNKHEELKIFQLCTVTYGTSSAPYLATRCLLQLAQEMETVFPIESKILKTNTYVDDILTGSSCMTELQAIKNNLTKLLATAEITLHKWVSNVPNALSIANSDNSVEISCNEQKTLGILWNPQSDTFHYCMQENSTNNSHPTKRSILSLTAKLFDPLGLITPVTIIARLIIQDLWKQNLDWDTPVPSKHAEDWTRFNSELDKLSVLSIPRFALHKNSSNVEIHGFSDASEKAYGACLYMRTEVDGKIYTHLLTSRSRVAPLRNVTLPRLELCAALILAQLFDKVISVIKDTINVNKYFLWSDSTIALTWIKSHPSRWTTFVANRVSEIQNLTNQNHWYHVPTKMNPADLISRGIFPSEIADLKLWWHGPSFLCQQSTLWPKVDITLGTDICEQKRKTIVLTSIQTYDLPVIKKFSSYSKLLRVLAYCLKFINRIKKRTTENAISPSEIKDAELLVIKIVQSQSFFKEISILKERKTVEKSSKIYHLSPFLDQNSILRVGSRIQTNETPSYYNQILLPRNHHVTKIIARSLHIGRLHCGPQSLLYALREKFWILNGRNFSRSIVFNCIQCYKSNPKALAPTMGKLPTDRTNPVPPFYICGTDFAGPLSLKNHKGRGAKITKAYVCIFICFVTKAVHIELVTSLSTEAFLACLRRFVSRRGLVHKIYSDNGTNFVGANNELKDLYKFLANKNTTEELQNKVSDNGINWLFIPSRSPHMGGLWEAGVRSIKTHLKRVVGNNSLTYEELLTVLTQIEAILNSRPLSYVNNDPKDPSPLTPSHFLIGRPLTSVADPSLAHIKENRLSSFQKLQSITQHFWTRWRQEYLTEIQMKRRMKESTEQLKIGDVVLLKDENLPPLVWKMAVVEEVHPGADNIVRVASVRLNNGTVTRRACKKLCPLPRENSDD